MTELQGFAPPYTVSGRSALIPNPPWFYSGDLLTVEYRTDVEKVRALLPADVELAAEDPGAVAFIWADWQSCSDGGEELLDPARSQYKEAFAVVRCQFEGVTYSRCVADLGHHRLRDRPRRPPGLPEEARLDPPDPADAVRQAAPRGSRRAAGSAPRSRRTTTGWPRPSSR